MTQPLNEHELTAGYYDRGLKVLDGQPADAGPKLARILSAEDALRDPKHRAHDIVKRDIQQIYERAYAPPPVAPPHVRASAKQQIEQLKASEAYSNAAHPDHARVVAQARQAYEVAQSADGSPEIVGPSGAWA